MSRNFKVSQKGNSIDVSVREDIEAGQKDKQPDAPDRTAELSGLDPDVNAPDWEAREIGETGTLTWYRRGKVAGRPMRSCSATVTGNDFGSPHDNANDWAINWDITSDDHQRHRGLAPARTDDPTTDDRPPTPDPLISERKRASHGTPHRNHPDPHPPAWRRPTPRSSRPTTRSSHSTRMPFCMCATRPVGRSC